MLRAILQQARTGKLAGDWREKLHSSESEIAEALVVLLPQDWEPGSGVGWRRALDAWHAAMEDCLAAARRAGDEVRRMLPQAAIADGYEMDCDLARASYRAGLAGGGLDVEWFEWLVERVNRWPDKGRARDQLDAMTLDPDYRSTVEQLPLYWA